MRGLDKAAESIAVDVLVGTLARTRMRIGNALVIVHLGVNVRSADFTVSTACDSTKHSSLDRAALSPAASRTIESLDLVQSVEPKSISILVNTPCLARSYAWLGRDEIARYSSRDILKTFGLLDTSFLLVSTEACPKVTWKSDLSERLGE